jgi:hypothetical protein
MRTASLVWGWIISLLLAGCAGMITKWQCARTSCLPREQATNKCLAQANAAFATRTAKARICEQCMRGEGFTEVPCAEPERRSPECRLLHVF